MGASLKELHWLTHLAWQLVPTFVHLIVFERKIGQKYVSRHFEFFVVIINIKKPAYSIRIIFVILKLNVMAAPPSLDFPT
jgi:hypothetical protein